MSYGETVEMCARSVEILVNIFDANNNVRGEREYNCKEIYNRR